MLIHIPAVPLKLRFRAPLQALSSPAPLTLRLREAATFLVSPFQLGSDGSFGKALPPGFTNPRLSEERLLPIVSVLAFVILSYHHLSFLSTTLALICAFFNRCSGFGSEIYPLFFLPFFILCFPARLQALLLMGLRLANTTPDTPPATAPIASSSAITAGGVPLPSTSE